MKKIPIRMKAYEKVSVEEKKKAEGFRRLAEYEDYYLYGKYKFGKLLYRECFSKFDIDGVPERTIEPEGKHASRCRAHGYEEYWKRNLRK